MINFIIVMHDFINTFFFVLLEVLIFFYNYFIGYLQRLLLLNFCIYQFSFYRLEDFLMILIIIGCFNMIDNHLVVVNINRC